MFAVGILGHGQRRPRPGLAPRARAVALDWGIFSQHFRGELIPDPVDQNPCAQSRRPMDMIRQG